jgi:regulator of PEP synthase PpsR (kinase-PPPase family)
MSKLKTIEKEIAEVEESISKTSASMINSTNTNVEDDLDAYMSSLQDETLNPKKSKAALKVRKVFYKY